MKPSPSLKKKQSAMRLPLLVLGLSLTACASNQEVPSTLPKLPTPPALTTPLPQQPYLKSVEALLSRWRSRLMGTLPTSTQPEEVGPHGTSSPAK